MGWRIQHGRVAAIGFVLASWVIAIYWPALTFDFVDYDDNEYVFENETVLQGLTSWGFIWAFVDFHVSNYHPITWLSHMLDCEWFGTDAGGHHLVSFVLHAINAVLVFLVLRSLTGSLWRSALVAALFAMHPLRVESVAWISERKDVLSGFFFLLTLLAYSRYCGRRTADTTSNDRGNFLRDKSYWLALILFVFGLLSKAMLVTLPAVLLLLDAWPLNRLRASGTVPAFRGLSRHVLLEKIPFFATSILFCLATVLAQRAGGAIRTLEMGERCVNLLAAYQGYLAKTIWPANLSVIYLRPEGIAPMATLLAVGLLIAITAAVTWRRKSAPFATMGWFWFIGMLIPVSGVVPLGDLYMADRYTYLPAIGLMIALVWGAAHLLRRGSGLKSTRAAVAVAACCVLMALSVATRHQLQYWRNTETLMQRTLAIDEGNFVAHLNLAEYYTRIGNAELARRHRDQAALTMPQLD
ncbi:MAG TPA: hypothetical protein VEH04_17190 [Verrucomicrobiae bacterium]|nr:hypothetical protein [Verrucomicrobiae bacterium]